jgi:hypothetical protein
MLEIIRKELRMLENINYYGSKNQIENENLIVRFAFKDLGIEMLYNEALEEFYKRCECFYKLQD